MAEQNKLQDMIRTSLESLRAMVDANTVVGTPINTPAGTTIIPISKVSVGYASGGTDFGKATSPKNFAGGGGTGLSVQPVCFLAIARVADLVEKTPDILSRIKAIFKKNKKDERDEALDDVAEAAAEAVEALQESEA